jgi:DNA-binding MarR family transcriptional regulator
VTSGAVTKKVDRLAELDLVERMPDPDNQTGFLVHLTRKGQQAAEDGVEQVACQSILAPAMTQFTKAEQTAGSQFALRTLAALESFASGADVAEADEDGAISNVAPKPTRARKGKGR